MKYTSLIKGKKMRCLKTKYYSLINIMNHCNFLSQITSLEIISIRKEIRIKLNIEANIFFKK